VVGGGVNYRVVAGSLVTIKAERDPHKRAYHLKKNDVTTWQTFRQLWPMIAPFKLGLVLASLALAGNAAIDLKMVWLIKPLLDAGFRQTDPQVLRWMPLTILLLMLLRGLSQFVASYGLAWVSGEVVMTLRRRLFDHLMSLPVPFFDRQSTGSLLSRITYDCEQVANSTAGILITLVREGAFVIGALCVMCYQSWQLSSIIILIAPLVCLTIHRVSKRFRILSKRLQEAMGAMTVRAEQMLKGHREVLLFGAQATESQRFARVSNQMRQQKMKIVATSALTEPFIQFIASTALAFILYAATLPSIRHTLSAGTLTALFGTMFSLLRPLKSLTTVNTLFQQGMAACQTLFDLLAIPTEQDNGLELLPAVSPEITWSNVTFRYPNKHKPTLKQITMTIPAGSRVAIVGRSGAGKSTLVSLLTRFYELQEGSIQLHGRDIREYCLTSLRRQIAVVSQQIHLFDDTIANNIAYGCDTPISDEAIFAAACQASVTEFSQSLPLGLETPIGENGILLSGGQRQRIAIARALLRNSPLLILDEATSALDNASEKLVQAALQHLKKNRTVLIIAHRLSTIEQADRIVVLEGGEIVETGSHQELLACSGRYAAWYSLQ
jgi:ATP-binding cassette, subfamily B, bacterial MsbA